MAVLLVAVVATAAIVSATFLLIRRHSSAVPMAIQTTPGEPQPASGKPSAIPAAVMATPVPSPLTDEQVFKLAAPSVALLKAFDQSGQPTKLGSGFIAAPGAIVVTNYHVIRGAYSETASFQDGSSASVLGVLGYDPGIDVAVIRIGTVSAAPLQLGDSDKVQIGDRVTAIGSPLGLQNTISDGLVSAFRGSRIQTSTPISPGSSGGPFFNKRGQVIGVAVSTILGAQNLNFVVPINQAKQYLTNASLTTLADLSRENTVQVPVLREAVTIPAHQVRALPLVIDENHMDDAELTGSFHSSGGIDGRVQVVVLNAVARTALYDSGRVADGTIDVRLPPGKYVVILSNRGSLAFSRLVNADLSLRYVK